MKKYLYLDLGKRLKKLRKNLSQKEFAEKIDVSFRAYQRYESGERLPPEPVLRRVAEVCNTTIEEMLGKDSFASLKRFFDSERQKIAEEKAGLTALEEKLRNKLLEWGIPIPQNTTAFLEVLTFYNKQGIHLVEMIKKQGSPEKQAGIVPYSPYTPEEQELMNMLMGVLRGKNEDNRKAIIENIRAFYKTRDVEIPEELKKVNHAG